MTIKKLIAIILSILCFSTSAFAAEINTSASHNSPETINAAEEDTFVFTNLNERMYSDGSFTFSGRLIRSDYFAVNSSNTTITAYALSNNPNSSSQTFTIELYEIDDLGHAYSKGKKTYAADGGYDSHTFTGLTPGRKLYFFIEYNPLNNKYSISGHGSVSNFSKIFNS